MDEMQKGKEWQYKKCHWQAILCKGPVPRNHNMWHSVIVSVAVTDREMYAEHRAPSAPPGGPLMNHHFRVGNWQTSAWIISSNLQVQFTQQVRNEACIY
jgi:hypothetical protein